jgi:hypothetical protein
MQTWSMPCSPSRAWTALLGTLSFRGRAARSSASVASTLRRQQPRKILCIGHDAGFYGAQLLLLLHIAGCPKEKFRLEVTTVLLGDGPLREDFALIGPVVDFTSSYWRTKAPVKDKMRRIAPPEAAAV